LWQTNFDQTICTLIGFFEKQKIRPIRKRTDRLFEWKGNVHSISIQQTKYNMSNHYSLEHHGCLFEGGGWSGSQGWFWGSGQPVLVNTISGPVPFGPNHLHNTGAPEVPYHSAPVGQTLDP
jgi:hypothetical protein